LRLDGLPALAHAQGVFLEPAMQAHWSGKAQPSPAAAAHPRKSSRRFGIAGLLAFGSLAFGIFMASNDTCAQRDSGAGSDYSQSTLAPITATGTASPSLRDSSCRRKPGRSLRMKTVR
jgi:hypothetical protein